MVKPDSRPRSGLYVRGATSLTVGNPCSLCPNRKAMYTMACFSAWRWAWGGMVDRRMTVSLSSVFGSSVTMMHTHTHTHTHTHFPFGCGMCIEMRRARLLSVIRRSGETTRVLEARPSPTEEHKTDISFAILVRMFRWILVRQRWHTPRSGDTSWCQGRLGM